MPLVDEMPDAFFRFCESLPGAERIDSLDLPSGLQKADYLFRDRTIVCEIKTLETETNNKLIPILRAAGLNLTPGTFELNKLLEGREDAEDLYWKCVDAITTGVKSGMDSANRQIADTKKALNIPDADGLWIILHPKVHVLNPDVILTRIARRLAKRGASDGPAYDQITAYVLFSEIHKLKRTDGTMMAAVIPVLNHEVPPKNELSSFLDELIEGWAAWNGRTTHSIHRSQLS